MGCKRILHFELDRVDRPGVVPAAGILNRYIVIRQTQQVAGVLFAVGVGHRSGGAPLLRVEKTRLQYHRGILAGNPREIAGDRVAGGTPGRVEEGLAGLGVTREQLVGGSPGRSIRRTDIRRRDPRLNKGYDVGHLARAQLDRRHSLLRTAVPDHRPDEVAVLVMPHHRATDEARPVSSAVGIRTMAEPARLRKLRASPFHGAGRRLGTAGRVPCAHAQAAIASAGMHLLVTYLIIARSTIVSQNWHVTPSPA